VLSSNKDNIKEIQAYLYNYELTKVEIDKFEYENMLIQLNEHKSENKSLRQ